MKLLVTLSRFPYPLEKGDKLRAYHQIKELAKFHEIYLLALNAQKVSAEERLQLEPYCKEIHIVYLHFFARFFFILLLFLKGLPFQCGYFYNWKAKRKINQIIKRVQPDHIYVQLVRMTEYVKNCSIPKTLDYQDVLSKGMQRRADAATWYLRPVFKIEYRRLEKYEKTVYSYFDHHTIITGVDRDLIYHPDFQQIEVIANGVDFDTFHYMGEKKVYDLIFTGNMNYLPNINAAEYLALQIFPLLKKEFPKLTLVLCGVNPAAKVRQLATKDIIVTGWVPTISEYYAKSYIFVAPMQLGTGLQNKLLEAMAMKLPCVTSSLAGKPLKNVVSGKDILICNSTIGYVNAIKSLLSTPALWQELSENAYHFVRNNYKWEHTTKQLNDLLCS